MDDLIVTLRQAVPQLVGALLVAACWTTYALIRRALKPPPPPPPEPLLPLGDECDEVLLRLKVGEGWAEAQKLGMPGVSCGSLWVGTCGITWVGEYMPKWNDRELELVGQAAQQRLRKVQEEVAKVRRQLGRRELGLEAEYGPDYEG